MFWSKDKMLMREVKNLTNIRLTESDTDGIWLHFDGGNLKAGISLGSLFTHGVITSEAIEAWAREQLDKQDTAHRRFYLELPPAPSNEFLKEGNEGRTDRPGGTRPSPPVDGGY